ncbi:hypothetical protein DL95DRAFT_464402 [Leptodontidium sp. 2 PMI_412]|nr:hypothetical protein DL95DRAFT_464402 [Leptodontidium sp. 2 PMI_412]
MLFSHSATGLATLLLLLSSALAHPEPVVAETCTPVSYAALLSLKPADQYLRIGPSGYIVNLDAACYVFPVTSPDFAPFEAKHTAALAAALEQERVKSESPQRRTPGCGQICDYGDPCLYPCSCQYAGILDIGDDFVSYYTCQG